MAQQPPPETTRPLDRLVLVIRALLAPGGCPWDRAQTHESLKPYLIEECHELIDAIGRSDPEAIEEELGDVLLQVALHAELARVAGRFDIEDVAAGIARKVIGRHPHVFGDGAPLERPEDVEARWDAEKKIEKGNRSILDGVPASLPSLLAAATLSRRAARAGFDWPDAAAVRAKLDEEIRELDAAVSAGDPREIRHEVGDVLFVVANLARHLGHDAEEALRECAGRFRTRFREMEAEAEASGRPLAPAAGGAPRPIEELDAMWERAKSRTRSR